MADHVFNLAVVMLFASVLGVVAHLLRQPVILAYLATGALIGYFDFFSLDHETFQTFSDLGIMFLLFLVGLEINYASLRSVGRVSLMLGVGQVLITSVIGFFLAQLFGFAAIPALYIAVALTFSSTIIIVKLLSEKRDLHSLYGKISVGMLLVQDAIAILVLMMLAGFDGKTGGALAWGVFVTLLKGASLFAFMIWIGKKVLPAIFDRAARKEELLFLVSTAWVLVIAAIVSQINFSVEIAGFLAGIALANSLEHFQIAGRIRSLRDFFVLVFFVSLGSSFALANFGGIIFPIIALSLFVLIGNPLIVMAIMGVMGYRRRTSFLTGLTVAQISEFSLVLAALGLRVGHLDASAVSLVTGVGIITITASSYFITHADALYARLARFLRLFERRLVIEDEGADSGFHRPVVLIGAHRTGQSIAASVPKDQLLVIEFDPDIITELRNAGYEYAFGDIGDPEMIERTNLASARLVISTSPDFGDNALLLDTLRPLPRRPKLIVRADTEIDAKLLYERGADYVLLPNFTAGQYIGKTIALDPEVRILDTLKRRDIAMLAGKGYAPAI